MRSAGATMELTNQLNVKNRAEWRDWLQSHFESETGNWLIFYKKHTGKPSLPYDDAVEEAICFGWINSIIKRVDDQKYAQKFTPRKAGSNWSHANIQRAQKMIKQNKMTPAGFAFFEQLKKNSNKIVAQKVTAKELVIPADLTEALSQNKTAQQNFNNFAFSYKRNYVGWINSAKKEETRKRRIEEAVLFIEQNVKNLMK